MTTRSSEDQEAVAGLMHGWLLVLTLVNLTLADTLVWFVIAQGWPWTGNTMP